MRWRLFLFAAPFAVVALVIAFLAVSWQGTWTAVAGVERVRAFDLDVARYGLSPSIYWLADPPRLVLAPESVVPRMEAVENVFVVPLAGGDGDWQRMAPADLEDAVSVRWSIERDLDQDGDTQRLYADTDRTGAVAEVTFGGIELRLPAYNVNIPALGEPGWRLMSSWSGRMRLVVRPRPGAEPDMVLAQIIHNSALRLDAHSLTFLPGGRYVVVDLIPYGDRRVLLLGPVAPAP